MRQEDWTIKTKDSHKIYGFTDFASENADKCLVLVHGLTGHMNEYLQKSAANHFSDNGYDVFRFNLYHWAESARKINECTLETHAEDLNTVLKDKTKGYSRVYLAGHSYGGPTIMVAQPENVSAISLWDPSFDLPNIIGKDIGDREIEGGYIMDSGVPWLCGEGMLSEMKTRYDTKECLSLSEALSNIPLQVVTAASPDHAVYHKETYSWNDKGHPDNERIFIDDADHCFLRGNTMHDLFEHTHSWFQKY